MWIALHPESSVDAALLAAVIVGALVVIGGAIGIVMWAQAAPRRTRDGDGAPAPVYLPMGHEYAGSPLRPQAAPPTVQTVPADAAAAMAREEAAVQPLALAVGAERERGWSADGGAIGLRPRRRPIVGRPTPEPTEAPSPLTGTLRMLPGRLEVVSGLEQRAEIRFVQTATAADQRVTLGRAPGTPYEHVTLASPTVSREHAAMTFGRDGWTITNLSATNPVRVNGASVAVGGAAVLLSDGDLVELGEVVLRFRI